MLTFLEVSDVVGSPKAKLDLPQASLGEKLNLTFCLRRKTGGRHEILEVRGLYRVSGVAVEFSPGRPQAQHLVVESIGVAPHWRAVKQNPQPLRVLPPLKGERFKVEGW